MGGCSARQHKRSTDGLSHPEELEQMPPRYFYRYYAVALKTQMETDIRTTARFRAERMAEMYRVCAMAALQRESLILWMTLLCEQQQRRRQKQLRWRPQLSTIYETI